MRGFCSEVECLPSMREVLSSILSTTNQTNAKIPQSAKHTGFPRVSRSKTETNTQLKLAKLPESLEVSNSHVLG